MEDICTRVQKGLLPSHLQNRFPVGHDPSIYVCVSVVSVSVCPSCLRLANTKEYNPRDLSSSAQKSKEKRLTVVPLQS